MLIIRNKISDLSIKNKEYQIRVNMVMVKNGVEYYGYDDQYYGYDTNKYGFFTGEKEYSKI